MDWLSKLNQMKKESGKTTEEISVISGIPKGTLNKLFAGQTKDPQLGTVRAVVHCLGHTLDDLDDSCSVEIKSPEPAVTDSREMQEEEVYQILKKTFSELNINVGSLTERQKAVLEVLADMIARNF